MKDYTEKRLEEMEEKFVNGLFRKEKKPIVDLQSMISGGNKDVYGYTESFINCKKDIEAFLSESIQQAVAEERARIIKIIDSHTYSDSMIDMYTDELIDEIEKITKKD